MRHSTLVSAAVDTLGKEALSPWDWLDALGIRSGSDLANWTYSDREDEMRENATCILGDRVRKEPERFNNLLKMWKLPRARGCLGRAGLEAIPFRDPIIGRGPVQGCQGGGATASGPKTLTPG